MRSSIVVIIVALTCFVAGCNDTHESTAEVKFNSNTSETSNGNGDHANPAGNANSKINIGTKLDAALATLDAASATNESTWQWGGFDDDSDVKWRDLSDGITLAIHFKISTQEIAALQIMYIPPNYDSRGNYRTVDVLSVEFHQDKTYTVHFDKH